MTPDTASHFFGFYDICPWSHDGARLLVMRFEGQIARDPHGERAEVCVWTPSTGAVEPIGSTIGWGLQMGARARWLNNGDVLFNDVLEGREIARIVSPTGVERRRLDMAVATLSAGETIGLSPNFARLARYSPTYGYLAVLNADIPADDPTKDGLWRIDMATGTARLELNLAELAAAAGVRAQPQHFVTHPMFARGGENFLTFLAIPSDSESIYSTVLARLSKTGELRVINREKNSHPAWLDERTFIMWCRTTPFVGALRSRRLLQAFGIRHLVTLVRRWQGPARNRLLAEGFRRYSIDGSQQSWAVGGDVLTEDGHSSIHPTLPVMVSDTYADAENRLHLYLYSFETGERIDVASFFHGVLSANWHLRCDLHPRWDRSGRFVSIDICENGIRRNAIVDVSKALAALS